ncbi:MAG: hypothetical protein R3E12_02055 [Candidatus Eisenbacteria bacterium]
MEAAVPTVAILAQAGHTSGGSKWNIKYDRIRWPAPPESADGNQLENSILGYKERHSG